MLAVRVLRRREGQIYEQRGALRACSPSEDAVLLPYLYVRIAEKLSEEHSNCRLGKEVTCA